MSGRSPSRAKNSTAARRNATPVSVRGCTSASTPSPSFCGETARAVGWLAPRLPNCMGERARRLRSVWQRARFGSRRVVGGQRPVLWWPHASHRVCGSSRFCCWLSRSRRPGRTAFARPTSAASPSSSPVETVVASPAALAPAPVAASRLARSPGRAPVGRSGAGLAEVTGILIATLGLAGFGRSWRRDRRMAVATVTAALVLGFVVETTPHLVHHALDPDKGAGCEALQTAERSQAAIGALDTTPALGSCPPDRPAVDRARSRARRARALRARPSGLGPLPPSTSLRAPTTRGRAGLVPTLHVRVSRGSDPCTSGGLSRDHRRRSERRSIGVRPTRARLPGLASAPPDGRGPSPGIGPAGVAGGSACRPGDDGSRVECAPGRVAARGGDPVHRAGRGAPEHARGAGRARPAGRPGRGRRRSRRSVALPRRAAAPAGRRLHRVLARAVGGRRACHQRRPRLHGRCGLLRRGTGGGIRTHGPERSGMEAPRAMAGRGGGSASPGRPRRRPVCSASGGRRWIGGMETLGAIGGGGRRDSRSRAPGPRARRRRGRWLACWRRSSARRPVSCGSAGAGSSRCSC